MPEAGAPNGHVVLPGPGIDDEVTKIDANSPTARGATPQRPVFESAAVNGTGSESALWREARPENAGSNRNARDEGAAPRYRTHPLHPRQLQHPDEIAGIETRAAAGAPSRAKPGTEAGRARRNGEAPRAVDARTAEERTAESRAGEGRTAEPRSVEPGLIDPPSGEAEPEPVLVAESMIAEAAVQGAVAGALPEDTAERLRTAGARPGGLRGAFQLMRDLVMRTYRRGVEIELMHRAFGFAALGFVTLVPLLIVVAAAAPLNGRSFPAWAIAGIGLSGRAAGAVNGLFGPAARVLSTTTALSAAVLAVFGLSFVSVVQTGMARVWELPVARLLSVWRQVIWLAVLIGLLIVGADLLALLHDGWFITTLRWCATAGGALGFFWWTQHFLLESRVPWRALLPGAVLTVAGLVGLRIFSAVIFGPMLVSSAITYGAIGSVLILVSWLIGIGYVIFGAALVGRVLYEGFGGGRE